MPARGLVGSFEPEPRVAWEHKKEYPILVLLGLDIPFRTHWSSPAGCRKSPVAGFPGCCSQLRRGFVASASGEVVVGGRGEEDEGAGQRRSAC